MATPPGPRAARLTSRDHLPAREGPGGGVQLKRFEEPERLRPQGKGTALDNKAGGIAAQRQRLRPPRPESADELMQSIQAQRGDL